MRFSTLDSSRLLRALSIVAFWTAFGILSAGQIYVRNVAAGDAHPFADACHVVYFYWVWALVTPLALATARTVFAPDLPRSRRIAVGIAGSIATVLLQSVFYTIVERIVDSDYQVPFLKELTGTIARHGGGNLFTMTLVLAAYAAFATYRRAHARELEAAEAARRASELESTLAQMRLDSLANHLRPHFLFNTLNMVSALISMGDATTANRVIAQLGVLLREAFASPNEHDASLGAEVAFTRRYLEIAQLRFGSRLSVVEHIDPVALSTRVPRFVLQPLVENAIIHGIATREQGGQLAIDVSRDNGTVVIRVKDNGIGLPAGAVERGMGLPIVRERLRQLYGDAAALTVANADDSGVVAELRVPAAPESAESSAT